MMPVAYEFRVGVRFRQRSPGHARLAVVQSPHPVEQMDKQAGSGCDSFFTTIVIGICVGETNENAVAADAADEFKGAAPFRCQGHFYNRTLSQLLPTAEFIQVRVAEKIRALCPFVFFRKIRAL